MIKIGNYKVIGSEGSVCDVQKSMDSLKNSNREDNVITLCGSSKFKDEFLKVQKILSLKGYLVLSPGLFGHSGDDEAWEKKALLAQVHRQRIDMSFAVFVIDVNGYIGESTKLEIEYALSKGKKIYFYSHQDLEMVRETAHDLLCEHTMAVHVDITAPLYWWKSLYTYEDDTIAKSCSTMHKITTKEFTLDDFSCEHLVNKYVIEQILKELNWWRKACLIEDDSSRKEYICSRWDAEHVQTDLTIKDCWWQIIQQLPSSYNQRRSVTLDYEVLSNIYKYRKDHKLDEWVEFCGWIETLPYSELITKEV